MKREKEIEAFLKGELPSEEKLKYEIARELGVLDQDDRKRLEKSFRKRNRTDWWSDDKKKKKPVKISKKL